MKKRTDNIIFIVSLILVGIFLFFISNAFALDKDEAEQYVGTYCYIQYYHNEKSDIEIYDKVVGKVLDMIFDEKWKLIVIDYKADLYFISIDRVKVIKLLRKD